MRLLLTALVACLSVAVQAQATGTLAGTVRDAATAAPLPGAVVVVVGTPLGAATDAEGRYTVRDVPAGTYTVAARYVGYEPLAVAGVVVAAGHTQLLRPRLHADPSAETVRVCCAAVMDRSAYPARTLTRDDMRRLPVGR